MVNREIQGLGKGSCRKALHRMRSGELLPLRGSVLNSTRSQLNEAKAPVASEMEVVQRHSEHAELVAAARPALEQARLLLAEASSMIILTDPSGVILETAGDPRTVDFGRMMHLEQGGHWAEVDIETNAIGTAIAALQPVQINGFEHFCSEVQRWTCAASPNLAPY